MSSGQSVLLRALTLTGGNATGATDTGNGGAIRSAGTLTVERCTFTGNTISNAGAGIHNAGGALAVTQCTFTGNNAPGGGGAFSTFNAASPVTVTHSALSGNTASYGGGGICNFNGPLTLRNSIVAGNTSNAGNGLDIRNEGNASADITYQNANIVQSLANFGDTITGTATNAAPLLAPLGSYGGPTQTMALLPNSPARNTATVLVPALTSDQRGFLIIAPAPDIGAYEAGTFTNFNAYIWESLPTTGNGTPTDPLHAATFDYDSDGQTNFNEWLALTSPADSTSYLRVTQTTITGDTFNVTFPTVIGRNYSLEAKTDLANPAAWVTVPGSAFTATTTTKTASISPITGLTTYFVRVRVGP